MRLRGFIYFLPVFRSSFSVQVSANVILKNIENIFLGNDVYIAPNCVINAPGRVEISNEVMIGFNSVIVSSNHTLVNKSFRFGPRDVGTIYIGYGSWIGANCSILSGAKIGSSVLVGSNSVVNSTCENNSLYAGSPAVLKKRFK